MVSISNSSELKTCLVQARSAFGQIEGLGSSYINSVFAAGEDVAALVTGDDSQKASAIQGLINNAMSLVKKIIAQEAENVKREVKQQQKKAIDFTKATEHTQTELQTGLEQIGAEIENQSEVVNNSVGDIEKAQKALDEKQQEINEIIEEIQRKQGELANATEPKKQAKLLAEIQSLSGQIGAVVGSISEIEETVKTASENVESAVTGIETAKGNAVTIQQDGQMKIQEQAQQAVQGTQEAVATEVKGAGNQVAATTAQASAEAASKTAFTAGAAPKLYQVANDQRNAATTRKTGSVTNLRTVLQGIGKIASNSNLLATFNTSIGGALSNFDSLIGNSWNTLLPSVITSIGSFTPAGGSLTAELDKAVESDMQTIGYEINDKGKAKPKKEAGVNTDNTVPEEGSAEWRAEYHEDDELLTPDVELKKFEIKASA
ncbi:MAG: hypothetical protein E7Z92_08140 [Cyanobacteria bacterium SIG31]|nr:hypothetical protein [Cyanobacteria bacterium SIG31]